MIGYEVFPVRCSCQQTHHEPRLIALTGGPGAGKTAILEMARKNFCEHVIILPEAAGILFGGGFWRGESLEARKAAQRAIFHVQRELETIALKEKKAVVVLCDRGTLDGLAYWPSTPETFWAETGSNREAELARYQAVIHIRTPELTQGYNHDNPLRIETALEASRIDDRIVDAWTGHPKRQFIESRSAFVTKALTAMDLIRAELPLCCQGFGEDKRMQK